MTVINGIVIVLVVVIMTEISRIVIVIGVSNGSDDDNGDKKRDAAGAGWEQDVGNRTTHRVINQHLIKACLDETDCGIFGAAEQLIFAGAYLVTSQPLDLSTSLPLYLST